MKTVLIIGVGQFGVHIARRMEELRCEVMAVDTVEERIQEILPYVTNVCIGDATNEEFLRSLGIDNFDVCIVALGNSFQTSLETTSLLKELGAKTVISRAANDVQMKFLLRNGADEVKYASDSILDFIHLDSNYSIYELKAPEDWYGRTLAQIDVRKKYKLNVLTVKRDSEVFIPEPDTQILQGDIVFVIGGIRDIQKCFRI